MAATDYRRLLSQIYREHLQAENGLDGSWCAFFDGIEGDGNAWLGAGNEAAAVRKAIILGRIIENFRWRGHLAANLDPLGLAPVAADPEIALDSAALSIIGELNGATKSEESLLAQRSVNALLRRLQSIYCDTAGYEYMHIKNAVAREWLRKRIESGAPELGRSARISAARRLLEADEFEQFLAKRFVGKKVFGAEGAESLLSLLWAMLEKGVSLGLRSILMGGTSRGRLNQLVNFLGKPAIAVFAEMSDKAGASVDPQRSGDVPYHLGFSNSREVGTAAVTLTYCANPSHLEAVNTVAMGRVRALQDGLNGRDAKQAIMPMLVHTDASFAGQGVAAEAFQLSGLDAYAVGGAIHIVINNQIGFTTEPSQGRTSHYCTDAAKGIGVPVFHVNADDVDAVVRIAQLAMEYRQRFNGDAVIDLVCYRRKGHNELDEPAFTQPVMYERVARHQGARRIYLDLLQSQRVFSSEDEAAHARQYQSQLAEAYQASLSYKPNSGAPNQEGRGGEGVEPSTGVPEDRLRSIGMALTQIPTGIEPHPKILQIFEQRRAAIGAGAGINWGFAEALALGTLIAEGKPIRFSGQDTPRGAFSHRHYYVHDQENGRRAAIFENLPQPRAACQIFETPLAEYATLGFEYGYSLEAKDALVVWEAQFGDFANVAQPIFDQFISAGKDKWGEASRLVVLLPHGLEGQGAEHSSGRIERFLQLCAKDNMTVANCTTPANYFHLLRRQALFANTPLIVFTPKSLLRHKLAVASLTDLGAGARFQPFIPPEASEGLNQIIFCSGKLYWELESERRRLEIDTVGIARLEQLYPFPLDEVRSLIELHPEAQVVWCQEEPQNMGAWSYAAPLIDRILVEASSRKGPLVYVGRPSNPAPAIGTAAQHTRLQARMIAEALGVNR